MLILYCFPKLQTPNFRLILLALVINIKKQDTFRFLNEKLHTVMSVCPTGRTRTLTSVEATLGTPTSGV